VLLAPTSALVGTANARAMFVVKGGQVQRRDVRLGHLSGTQVEVLDGLVAGDQVVVAGMDNLRDGGRVRVVRPVGTPQGDGARPARPGAPGAVGNGATRGGTP
jgi:membrane fusion protein (multidrug efflux system)